MTSAATISDWDATQVRRVKAMLYIGRRHPRSPGYYRDAGQALALLREDRSYQMWAAIVRGHCGISPRRAYQLMEIAGGKDLKVMRQETSAAVRKHRKNKWLTTKPPRKNPSKTPQSDGSCALQGEVS